MENWKHQNTERPACYERVGAAKKCSNDTMWRILEERPQGGNCGGDTLCVQKVKTGRKEGEPWKGQGEDRG